MCKSLTGAGTSHTAAQSPEIFSHLELEKMLFFYFLIIIILFKISFKNRGFLLLFEQLGPITADSSDVRLMLSLCFLLPSSWYSGAPTFSACFRTINMIDPFF